MMFDGVDPNDRRERPKTVGASRRPFLLLAFFFFFFLLPTACHQIFFFSSFDLLAPSSRRRPVGTRQVPRAMSGESRSVGRRTAATADGFFSFSSFSPLGLFFFFFFFFFSISYHSNNVEKIKIRK
jgi:hypothetical protein